MGLRERFLDKVLPEPNSGCWLWDGGVGSHGYGAMNSKAHGHKLAHRISYELFIGAIPPNMLVLHSCDVRCCVNPDHLRIGTYKNNSDDKYARCKNGNWKLDAVAVKSIRADTRAYREIAVDYGVHYSLVGYVKKRKVWADIK